jgi:hypothetical protein
MFLINTYWKDYNLYGNWYSHEDKQSILNFWKSKAYHNKLATRFHTGPCVRQLHTRVNPKYSGLLANYKEVVVARSTGPKRPNCQFWVLMRRFAAIAWKRAKTSPWTLVRTDLAASPWQCPVPHFHYHPAISGEIQNGCRPPPTVLPWFTPCDFFLFPEMKLKLKGRRFDTTEEIQAESQRVLNTLTEKDFQETFQKWRRRRDRCLNAGGNYFEGDCSR